MGKSWSIARDHRNWLDLDHSTAFRSRPFFLLKCSTHRSTCNKRFPFFQNPSDVFQPYIHFPSPARRTPPLPHSPDGKACD